MHQKHPPANVAFSVAAFGVCAKTGVPVAKQRVSANHTMRAASKFICGVLSTRAADACLSSIADNFRSKAKATGRIDAPCHADSIPDRAATPIRQGIAG